MSSGHYRVEPIMILLNIIINLAAVCMCACEPYTACCIECDDVTDGQRVWVERVKDFIGVVHTHCDQFNQNDSTLTDGFPRNHKIST